MKPIIFSNKKSTFCVLVLVLSFCTAVNAICQPSKQRDYWPTKEWLAAAPEKHGMDSAKLILADEFIRNRLPDAFSLLVVKKRLSGVRKILFLGQTE